jgi:hypothetical protein
MPVASSSPRKPASGCFPRVGSENYGRLKLRTAEIGDLAKSRTGDSPDPADFE